MNINDVKSVTILFFIITDEYKFSWLPMCIKIYVVLCHCYYYCNVGEVRFSLKGQ